MKIVLKEVELNLSQEEVDSPLSHLVSYWLKEIPKEESSLLPMKEIAAHLGISAVAFRSRCSRDERLKELSYLRNGLKPEPGYHGIRYFRLAEVRPLYSKRKRRNAETPVQGSLPSP